MPVKKRRIPTKIEIILRFRTIFFQSYKALQAEIEQLTAEKNAHYNEYREKKARVKELHTVKSNLSQILQGEKDREKKHKHER